MTFKIFGRKAQKIEQIRGSIDQLFENADPKMRPEGWDYDTVLGKLRETPSKYFADKNLESYFDDQELKAYLSKKIGVVYRATNTIGTDLFRGMIPNREGKSYDLGEYNKRLVIGAIQGAYDVVGMSAMYKRLSGATLTQDMRKEGWVPAEKSV